MPLTDKQKVNKVDFVDIIRKAFVAKEDAEAIYEEIHEMVLVKLDEGYSVNLFGCVSIESKTHPPTVIKDMFGQGDYMFPERRMLHTSVYPMLKNEWKIMQGI